MTNNMTPESVKEFQRMFGSVDEDIIITEAQKRRDVIEALNKKGIINVKVKVESKEKPFWDSKKFWGGIIALGIMIADQFTGADLWVVTLPVLVYIFGQGLADLGKNKSAT